MEKRRIAVTSPSGIWEQEDLIGGSCTIKSTSIFGPAYPDDAVFLISDIRYKFDQLGNVYTVIYLEGVPERGFALEELHLHGLDLWTYAKAICGMFCCGDTVCGYRTPQDLESLEDGDPDPIAGTEVEKVDGDTLD